MPRSWHSCMSYLSCKPTGSPHLLQNVTTFLLKVPQWWHRMSPAWNGSVRMVAPQLRHLQQERGDVLQQVRRPGGFAAQVRHAGVPGARHDLCGAPQGHHPVDGVFQGSRNPEEEL